MITTLTSRPLIFAAAMMLAAHSSAQTPVTALEKAVQPADSRNDPAGVKALLEKSTDPQLPEADECSIDLRLPAKMKDIASNVLLLSAKRPRAKVQEFLNDPEKHYATGDALMRAAAKHFMIDETQMAADVQRFKHINCTHGPFSSDPVRDLEQAVQLADIQNDLAGAKALLEKLIRPGIPTKILQQANARLAKMNPTIELNLGPGVKAFEGVVEYDKGKVKKVVVTHTDPPGPDEIVTNVYKVRLKSMEPSATEWLVARGVVFDEGTRASFNMSTKSLVVTNKRSELDKVTAILDQLSRPVIERSRGPIPTKLAKQLEQIIAKIDVKDAPAEAALKQITEQSSIAFHYKPGTSNASLTLQLKSVPAAIAINYVAELANLEVSCQDDGVHLEARVDSTTRPTAETRLTEAMQVLMTSGGAKDRSALVDAAIDGMAKTLSPNSGFVSPDSMAAFNAAMTSDHVGIGAILGSEEKAFVLKGIVKDSPAEKSGLVVGSEIMEVDGKTPFGLGGTLENLVAAIRGPSGSQVSLLLKEPDGKLRKVELARKTIKLEGPTVRQIGAPSSLFVHHVKADQPVTNKDLAVAHSWWVDEASGIAGVRLSTLLTSVAEELRKVLADPLFKDKPARGLIIDLRDNGGGSLEEAVGIVDLFVNDGAVVTVKSRDKTVTKPATPGEILAGVPIVVLINEGTASGAEVIAAALQDSHRATVIGRRSLGRAEVMTLMTLKSGGQIKIPLSELIRPSGKGLDRRTGMTEGDAWGVTPDIIVPGVGGRLPASTEVTQDWQNMIKAALAHFESLNAKK